MAGLLEKALRFQRALDGARGSVGSNATSAAGWALHMAHMASMNSSTGGVNFLEPVILRTTLATSVAAYLEHIPWTEVTLEMLAAHNATICECAGLLVIMHCQAPAVSGSRIPVPALLLRQVLHSPSRPPVKALGPHTWLSFG